MQTIFLEIRDDIKETILSFLRILPQDAVRIYDYEDTTFTAMDERDYQKAILEKNSGESISLESLKKKYEL